MRLFLAIMFALLRHSNRELPQAAYQYSSFLSSSVVFLLSQSAHGSLSRWHRLVVVYSSRLHDASATPYTAPKRPLHRRAMSTWRHVDSAHNYGMSLESRSHQKSVRGTIFFGNIGPVRPFFHWKFWSSCGILDPRRAPLKIGFPSIHTKIVTSSIMKLRTEDK